jgi:amino acid adenylation domain-containing protein
MADSSRSEGLSEKQRRLMELLKNQKQREGVVSPEVRTSIPRRRPSDPLVLSFGQKRLWFIEQLQPGNAGYNVPGAVRLRGPLGTAVLQRCLDEIGRRHEILRTSFQVVNGEPVPVIAERPSLRLITTDLRGIPADRREAEAARVIHDEVLVPFDMTRDPLSRTCLLRLGDEEHLFLLVLHHIICDIWSIGVFFRTMMSLYDSFLLDRPVTFPELPIQYTDYAIWQQQILREESLDSLLSYWKGQVEGAPFVIELPVDHPRPPVQSFIGRRAYMNLGVPLTESLKALGKGEDASLYMVLLAALHALLYRYTGQESILVGVPMANRNRLELEGLIGLLFNALVLRGDMTRRTTFRELLTQIRERTLGAFNHQDLPFERLVEDLRIERDMSRNPVFQVLFAFQNVPPSVMAAHGLAISRYEVLEATSREDFELDMRETPDGLAGWLGYDAVLFDHSTVQRATVHFQNLLRAMVSDPDLPLVDLPLLGAAETHVLLHEGNNGMAEGDGELSFMELFAAQVERTPDATAVLHEEGELTYRELRERGAALALHLAGLGTGRGDVVAVLGRRGVDFLTAVLGILEVGGAWLPLDPQHPPMRLAQVLSQSAAPLVLASDDLLPAVTAAVESLEQGVRPRIETLAAVLVPAGGREGGASFPRTGPSDLVYVIFTSGSTGLPKGAMVEQRGMLNHLLAKVEDLALGAADVVAQTASQCFDISVWQHLAPLLVGGRVHIYPDEVAHDPARLLERAGRDGLTVLESVPSLLRLIVEEARRAALPPSLPALRWMIATGEALPTELCREWAAAWPAIPLVNAYGPTECADRVSHHVLVAPPKESVPRVPIGRPIRATRFYVVDPELRRLPIGVAGELCVGGAGVGRGYLNAPERTAGVFVPDPFAARPGSRLYRTGDRVRRLADGTFDFMGRIDHQVKVRGFRIELGEIESVLGQYPAVRQSVVLAQETGLSERALVAYVVADLTGDDADRALRSFLHERLPEYMVPAGFVFLEEMPLTPNGKIDRRTLLARGASFSAREDFVAPRNPVEDSLAGIWAQVLRADRIGVYDNFFELGGQSLLATQVVSRIREAFGVELPVRVLFQKPTVAGLAEGIEIAMLRGRGIPDALPMIRIPRDGVLEPSFGQERFWFIDQFRPGLTAYNIFGAVRMRGELHLPTLQRSFDELMRRHEVLRTTFAAVDGRPVQVIHPPSGIRIPVADLRGLPEEIRPVVARRLNNEEPQYPFDLANGPLIRCVLLRVADDEHVLAVTAHHIVYDVWSRELLIRELGRLYEAFWHDRSSPLSELAIQYADFAWWQRRWLRGEVLDSQLAYWKKQLAGVTSGSELPSDRPRPPVQSFRGARVLHALPAATTAELKELSKRQGVTLFMTLLAGFDTFLHVYTGEEDIVVGSPIANRNRAETEALIGFFVNTQVLRTGLSGRPTFRQLLGRVRETALNAYAQQDLAFEQLVTELQASRDPARQPLFQVLFNFLTNYKPILMELPGLTLSPEPNHSGAVQFDLICSIYEADGALHFSADYSTDLFEHSTVVRLMEHYANLLEAAVADPDRTFSELPFWRPEEERQILVNWNATRTAYPREAALPELFAEVAAQWPDAPALLAPAAGERSSGEWTYRRLDEESNRLARRLRALGVGVESRVGLSMSRSPELILGTLAILKAGGAYVPLDASYPDERLAFMLADAGVRLVLVSAATQERVAALAPVFPIEEEGWLQEEASPLDVRVPAESLAYVIYTSGSTGRPKGVAVPHRAITRLVRETNYVRLGPGERTGHVANISFDAATYEIWGALLTGAAVVVTPREVVLTPADFAGWIQEQGITSMFLTSALFTRMARELPDAFATMSELLVGGEAVDPAAARRVLAGQPPRRLLNGYGPTESTTFAAWHLIREVPPDATSVPIGRPLANTTLYVLSRSGAAVPAGALGELCIGGDGLAWGYLNRPELTAERFVPHPWESGERLYRTGDLVRLRSDGAIDYLGRLDQQVKIRGFRIELEEIEAVLCSHRAVREAAVVAVEAKRGSGDDDEPDAASPGYHRLAACLVLQPGEPEPQAHALRTFLKERLPEYMVPSGFAILPSLPLTPNGKVDRRALAAAELSRLAPEADYVAPRTPLEESLARIWAELLEVERVGIHDSFFDLGGHSLLTTRLVSRIRDAFQLEVPLQTFFEDPTVAGMAEGIELARWADEVAQEPVAAGAAGGDFEEGEL